MALADSNRALLASAGEVATSIDAQVAAEDRLMGSAMDQMAANRGLIATNDELMAPYGAVAGGAEAAAAKQDVASASSKGLRDSVAGLSTGMLGIGAATVAVGYFAVRADVAFSWSCRLPTTGYCAQLGQ